MGRPYSKRFILNPLQGWSNPYVVPAGQVVSLKTILAMSTNAGAANVVLEVAGTQVWYVTVPGNGGLVSPPFMFVVNAGESIRLFNGLANIVSSCHGYLLGTS